MKDTISTSLSKVWF